MIVGVGLFGVLTGFLANTFLAPASEKPEKKDDEQPAAQAGQDPATLPVPAGFGAQLDQLTAEVARRRRLLERLPLTSASSPDTLESPRSNDAQRSSQEEL
jgi:hypothetical protein